MDFRNTKPLIIICSVCLIWSLLIWFLLRFSFVSPVLIFMTFAGLLIIPGFCLARIIQFKMSDFFDQFLSYISLGLVFGLILCLAGVLFHWTISVLLPVYLIGIGVIFVASLILDLKRPIDSMGNLDLKSLFKWTNLIGLLALIFVFMIITSICQQGGSFNGDPTYHLAIVEKAFSGHPLSFNSLAFIKNQPHPAYAFMIWPVFLAILAKITHLTTYNLWGEIPAAVTALVFLAWYGFFRKIFQNRYLSILALVIFAISMFGANGYLFTAIGVPDGLCKLVLLPLTFWLAFEYIFQKDPDQKILWLASIILTLTACIHLTQFFYYYFVMVAFMVVYSIFSFKDGDYKLKIKRMLTVTFANLVLMVPLFGYLQLETHIIDHSFQALSGIQADLSKTMAFSSIEIFALYAYILLPLVLLYLRKYRTLIVLLSAMIIVPIVYNIVPLRDFLNSIFSYVFMKRLFSNVSWYFAIWALIFGSLFLMIDQAVNRLTKNYKYAAICLIAVLSIIIWFFRLKISHLLFSRHADTWIVAHFWWLFGFFVLITAIIFIYQKFKKVECCAVIAEPKNWIVILCLSLALCSVLLADGEKNLFKTVKTNFKTKHWFKESRDYAKEVIEPQYFGDWDMLNYIQKNVPYGSVFESNKAYRDLEILVDVHMAAWPERTQPERELSAIYKSTTDMSIKIKCLSAYNVDYLLVCLLYTSPSPRD